MSTAQIDPKFALALQHAIKKAVNKTVRNDVPPGVYQQMTLDLSVKVGEMRVAQDTDKSPTCAIPLLPTLALLIKRMGCQRSEALKIIKEVMDEALKMGKDASQELLEESGVAEAEKMLKEEVISTLPRTPVKGAVTVSDVSVTVKSMAEHFPKKND